MRKDRFISIINGYSTIGTIGAKFHCVKFLYNIKLDSETKLFEGLKEAKYFTDDLSFNNKEKINVGLEAYNKLNNNQQLIIKKYKYIPDE